MRLIDATPYENCLIVANHEDGGVRVNEVKTWMQWKWYTHIGA